MKIAIANIVTCFSRMTIGTKVIDNASDNVSFWKETEKAIAGYDFDTCIVPGQGFIICHELAPYLSAGVGKRTPNTEDYVCRNHRGVVSAFLRREKAAPIKGAVLVIYTRYAYISDPEVSEEERERVKDSDYVLVAVLGFAGPKAPLTPDRFVKNLAGGNNETLEWTADEIRKKAEEVAKYSEEWCVVAD